MRQLGPYHKLVDGIVFRHVDDVEREHRQQQATRRKNRALEVAREAARLRSLRAYTAACAGRMTFEEIGRKKRALKIKRRALDIERKRQYRLKLLKDPTFDKRRYRAACRGIRRIDDKRQAWDRAVDRLAARAFS